MVFDFFIRSVNGTHHWYDLVITGDLRICLNPYGIIHSKGGPCPS